jgi:hypothetical protein
MKKMILLLIVPVVLVSLCTQLPSLPFGDMFQDTGSVVESGSPDILVKATSFSSQIKSGRSAQVSFELSNLQQYDLTNVILEVYDHPCFPDDSAKFIQQYAKIRPNQTVSWTWRWNSDPSDIDRACMIKFSVKYTANNYVYQDIAVLPESEYIQKESEGTLNDIPISSSYAKGPLNVYPTFSEPQPFMAGPPGQVMTGYVMKINYFNTGSGFFDSTSVTLNIPDNIAVSGCEDFSNLARTDKIDFIKGKAIPSECDFSTVSVPEMSIRSLGINLVYTYSVYNSFTITVKESKEAVSSTSGSSSSSSSSSSSFQCTGNPISCGQFASVEASIGCPTLQYGCLENPDLIGTCVGTPRPCNERTTQLQCEGDGMATGCTWA